MNVPTRLLLEQIGVSEAEYASLMTWLSEEQAKTLNLAAILGERELFDPPLKSIPICPAEHIWKARD